mmetsp:Transcript_30664/g.64053  ORF Transcript_30664/g.64053 Transcript_30664/m.64053 type:complete len:219 (+) Transcript_30664:2468-3124(+)
MGPIITVVVPFNFLHKGCITDGFAGHHGVRASFWTQLPQQSSHGSSQEFLIGSNISTGVWMRGIKGDNRKIEIGNHVIDQSIDIIRRLDGNALHTLSQPILEQWCKSGKTLGDSVGGAICIVWFVKQTFRTQFFTLVKPTFHHWSEKIRITIHQTKFQSLNGSCCHYHEQEKKLPHHGQRRNCRGLHGPQQNVNTWKKKTKTPPLLGKRYFGPVLLLG